MILRATLTSAQNNEESVVTSSSQPSSHLGLSMNLFFISRLTSTRSLLLCLSLSLPMCILVSVRLMYRLVSAEAITYEKVTVVHCSHDGGDFIQH